MLKFTEFTFNSLSLSQITLNQIEEYKQEISIFAESFNMHGPGAVGDDLEKGKSTRTLS